jgi:hypothetical protein
MVVIVVVTGVWVLVVMVMVIGIVAAAEARILRCCGWSVRRKQRWHRRYARSKCCRVNH